MPKNTDAPTPYTPGAQSPSVALPTGPAPTQAAPSSSGGKKNAPPPPDYAGAAQKQADSSAANVAAQTQANRPDQTNAFGSSVQWTKDANGNWVESQQLGSGLQGIENNLMQQAQDAYSKPFDNGSAARDQAINASYNQATSRLNPQWSEAQEQQEAQLANEGLDPSSAAYQNALRTFGNAKNDAYGSAMNSAISNGNQAQAQTFAENETARNMPGEELQGLQGFLTMPGFQGAGSADSLQALAAAMAGGNYNLGAWEAQNKAGADAASGGAQAASSLIPLLAMFA